MNNNNEDYTRFWENGKFKPKLLAEYIRKEHGMRFVTHQQAMAEMLYGDTLSRKEYGNLMALLS